MSNLKNSCRTAPICRDAELEAINRGLKEVRRRLAKRKIFPYRSCSHRLTAFKEVVSHYSLEAKTVSVILKAVGDILARGDMVVLQHITWHRDVPKSNKADQLVGERSTEPQLNTN